MKERNTTFVEKRKESGYTSPMQSYQNLCCPPEDALDQWLRRVPYEDSD